MNVKQQLRVRTPLLPHNAQTALEIKEDGSSLDSDDSIDQEIRRFLAEKAKAEKSKDGDVSRNSTMACTPLQDEDIKEGKSLSVTLNLSGQSPEESASTYLS